MRTPDAIHPLFALLLFQMQMMQMQDQLDTKSSQLDAQLFGCTAAISG